MGGTIRKDLDGLRVAPGEDPIYLMDQGKKRHIPDLATYGMLFVDGTGVQVDITVNEIAEGVPISGRCAGAGE